MCIRDRPTQDAIEEAVAEAYSDWAKQSAPRKAMSLFQRIATFFKRLQQHVMRFVDKKKAFNPDYIFSDVEAGKVGSRESSNQTAKASDRRQDQPKETPDQRRDRFVGNEGNKRKEFTFENGLVIRPYTKEEKDLMRVSAPRSVSYTHLTLPTILLV